MGVSALCRRASRLWKTPKILAASATPRKPWRPLQTFGKSFGKAASAWKKRKQHKNWKRKHVCVEFISQMILSLPLFCFEFIFMTLCTWNVICVQFTAVVFSWSVCEHVKVALVIHCHHVIILMEHCVGVGQIMTIMAIVFIVALHQVDGRWFDECPSRSKAVCRVCRVKGDSWKSWMLWKCRAQCWAVDVVSDVLCRNGFVARHVEVELNMWDWLMISFMLHFMEAFGSLQDVTNTSWGEHKRWWPDQTGNDICVA